MAGISRELRIHKNISVRVVMQEGENERKTRDKEVEGITILGLLPFPEKPCSTLCQRTHLHSLPCIHSFINKNLLSIYYELDTKLDPETTGMSHTGSLSSRNHRLAKKWDINSLERALREESAKCWGPRRGHDSLWPPLLELALWKVSFSQPLNMSTHSPSSKEARVWDC